MKIYTRKGDRGQTRLGDGSRVRKDAQRLECLGAIDELSSCIGLAAALLQAPGAPRSAARPVARLIRIQRELSGLCAELAIPGKGKQRIASRHVVALERAIDDWSARLPPLRAFILPGGGPAAACLHLARTICRRAEREVTRLAAHEPVADPVRRYLNRLADALFVAARFAAQLSGQADTLISPTT